MLNTSSARVDAVKLGPTNMKGGRLEHRRQNTAKTNGILSASRFTLIWQRCLRTAQLMGPSLLSLTERAVRPKTLAT